MLNGYFSGKYRHASAFFIFLILTLVMTYPLVLHLDDHLIGRGTADVWQFPWNNFIFRENILNGRDPYFTDYIYYPEGTSLLLHTNTELNSVVGLLVSPFFSEIGQMNVGILLSIFLSALGTYLLTFYLTGNWPGSVFAGLAFAFSPFLATRLFGHINFSLTQTLPFALWAFFRMAGTQLYRYGILTGILFGLTYYCNQYYLMFLIISFPFLLAFGLWRIPSWRTRKLFKNLCIAAVVASLMLAQVGWHFIRDRRERIIAEHPAGGGLARRGSAFLEDYIKPGPFLGLTGDAFGTGPHSKVTTGITTLLLALTGLILALIRRNERIILIGLLGILFLLITLGPSIAIGSLEIPLPYALMMKIPYMNHVRIPYRAAPMVALTFAVLAGAGVWFLVQRNSWWWKGLVACMFPLMLFELAGIPLKLHRFNPPAVYNQIRHMDDGSILTLPFHNNVANGAHQMKYQLVHRKKLLNGRTARSTPLLRQENYLKSIPIAGTFEKFTILPVNQKILSNLEVDQAAAPIFRQLFNVRYLAFHDKFAHRSDVLEYVSAVFPDARLMYEDHDARVYMLPALANDPSGISADKNTLRFFLFSGWKPGFRDKAICVKNQARMLLPAFINKNVMVEMNIRSRDDLAINRVKVVFSMNNQIIAETALKRKFEPFRFSVGEEQLKKAHRIVKIELIDQSTGKLFDFQDDGIPKLEMDQLRFNYR